ncbi:MAG TPA: short-chain dehydrogenase, partial [Rhodospirillaceae bacterium]|nr:short-chain dehydrogenase [Rhodospirillaceae bacterium]
AANNIAREAAVMMAEEGADLAICTLQSADDLAETARLVEAQGSRCFHRLMDVREEDQVQAFVAEAVGELGGLDILVNSAAVRRHFPFAEMTLERWRDAHRVILEGAFLCAHAAVPHMISAGGGAIINMGGVSGHQGHIERCHVTAAKAGIVGFTKGLAVELASQQIRVNCVVPGTIDTAQGTSRDTRIPHPSGGKPIWGREGRAEEPASMIRYLCLPEASYVTGQTIHVNGGYYLP